MDEYLEEVMDLIQEQPDDRERLLWILAFVYAKGVGNTMRAMGHWPALSESGSRD